MSSDSSPPSNESDQPAKPPPTVVGIGCSAGGLAALKQLFSRIPGDSGLAFAVVVHLSPEHESHMADLLQPHVQMPVQQVNQTIPIERNHVYIIPPNANLNAIDTHLRLSELEESRRERAPIDHFFRTLAATHDGRAIGVILTGSGSDGALGIREIKANGGVVIVQDPSDAEYDGMPQSAIATGLADLVQPLEAIPQTILRLARTKPELGALRADKVKDLVDTDRVALQKIFTQLQARTGRNFSHYKLSTIVRRLARRMQLHYMEDLERYLDLLRQQPDEAVALADDLLITITNFFRDPEVFEALEKKVIPKLFKGKGSDDAIRVWSVGCATGEEAYSLAMLLLEEAARVELSPRLQVFASDLHERSLAKAREGTYLGDIAGDVGTERLARFFHRHDGGYRIRKEVRDLVVFAPHNLLADPPFSRIDLILCRNLLIYLKRDVQNDVIGLFHYSLNRDGFLLLGPSESLEAGNLFQVEDKKLCLFKKRNVPPPEPRLPVFPAAQIRLPAGAEAPRQAQQPVPYGSLHQQMVERYGPPSLLVSEDDRVVHLSQRAGRYLYNPGGQPSVSVFKLIREELLIELRAGLHSARETHQPFESLPIPIEVEGKERAVVLHVSPSRAPEEQGLALVVFEERSAAPVTGSSEHAESSRSGTSSEVAETRAELDLARQRLQAIIEEYETSQEEMKASNEEMQSANEELRSTLEELETSKEELQSTNEELQTVNQENRHKVEELAQLSADLNNLLSATGIATLFLDRKLRILRFTSRVAELFSVRMADRGRPIDDLTNRLLYSELRADAQKVLEELIPIERELQDDAKRWYLTRLLPYRNHEDRIEGVVITFVDITDRKQAEESVRASEERLRRIINVESVGVLIFDETGTLVETNQAFLDLTGYTQQEVEDGRLTWRSLTPAEYVEVSERQLEKLAQTGRIGPYEKEYLRKDGSRFWLLFAGASLGDGTFVEYCVDVTDRKEVEQELRQSEERYRLLVESVQEYAIFMVDAQGRIASWNTGAKRIFGFSEEEIVGRHVGAIFTEEDREAGVPQAEMETAVREGQAADDRWQMRKDGSRFWASGVMETLRQNGGEIVGFMKVLRDNTERKRAEEELRRLNETLEQRVAERTREVGELASSLTVAEHQERDRIARILHDDLQQQLYSVQLKLTFLEKNVDSANREKLIAILHEAEQWIAESVETVHRLSVDLSPQVLEHEGLAGALRWLRSQVQELYGLRLNLSAESITVPKPVRIVLFQTVRELVFNAVKHADVPEVEVTMRQEGEDVLITVSDEGRGFDPGRLKKGAGFGLLNAKHRLSLLGAEMDIESSPGRGARFAVRMPCGEIERYQSETD